MKFYPVLLVLLLFQSIVYGQLSVSLGAIDNLSDNDKKIDAFNKLLLKAKPYKDTTAYIYYKLGHRFNRKMNDEKAAEYFKKAFDLHYHNGNCEGKQFGNIKQLIRSLMILKRYDEAIFYMNQATKIQNYNLEEIVFFMYNVQEILRLSNNPEPHLKVNEFQEKVIQYLKNNLDAVDYNDYYKDNLLEKGLAYESINNHKAVSTNENNLSFCLKNQMYFDAAKILNNMAVLDHKVLKNYRSSIKNYNRGLQYTNDINDKIICLKNIAVAYAELVDEKNCLKYISQVENLDSNSLETSNLSSIRSKLFYNLAKLDYALQEIRNAKQIFYKSKKIGKYSKNNNTLDFKALNTLLDFAIDEFNILIRIANVNQNDVISEINMIYDILDHIRQFQTDEKSKLIFRDKAASFYKNAIQFLSGKKQNFLQLKLIEQSKSSLLIENYIKITNENEFLEFSKSVEYLIKKNNPDSIDFVKCYNSLGKLIRLLHYRNTQKNKQFINNFEDYFQVIQKQNPPDHAYLDFFFTEDELLVFKITDKIEVHRIHLHPDIKDITNDYIDAIKNKKELCNGPIIYQAIMKPLGNLPPKLTIIADSYLSFLPFEALYSGKDIMDGVYKTYDFMIKKHNIKYNYSLGMQSLMQDKKSNGHAKYVFVPSFTKNNVEVVFAEERHSLLPLKFAEEEAALINKYYTTTTYKGQEATKNNFLQSLTNAKFIHFAGHAIINSDDHHLSFLAFGPDDNDDQKLYLKDLSGLTTNAEMIVLSACETASGKYAEGEGLLSLGRAMVACGSKSVLTSLWNANDWSGKNIMSSFYQHLKKGSHKSDALYQAKKDYLELKQINTHFHPYHWSAFIIIGDDRPFPDNKWAIWLKILVGAVCVSGLGLLIHRFRKRA